MQKKPRVHWLQHAEHEGLGCIAPWLEARGYPLRGTRLHAGEALPAARDFDWLIVMGGPMNIYEHGPHPWLAAEKQLINDACVKDKTILGICLGSQLLADVLGGPVTANPHEEIGFFDVELTEEGGNCSMFEGVPHRITAFHWHGDTFTTPAGCSSLMKSDACVNQGFLHGGKRLGLQFHPEVTAADARRWLATDPPRPGRYVQSAAEILATPARFTAGNDLMHMLLERLAATV